jgi:lauroyl/myristoyl acyltransferase
MRLADWSWNLLNLMALPLILGTGVDYSIFMQLALRRYHGDLQMARRAVGRALLLCGATAIAGFGSLAWSSNAGMASLGQVCAVGIAGNMLISVFLLPIWWHVLQGRRPKGEGQAESETSKFKVQGSRFDVPVPTSPFSPRPSPLSPHPSHFYRAGFWRLGILFVQIFPTRFCAWLIDLLIRIYRPLERHRYQIVVENLLPPLNGDRAKAELKARELFHQFGLKLIDLWRYEDLFGESTVWEHLARAQGQKRGVLILTCHLGNWEFGGPWLAKRGIALQVVTLAEPGQNFTKLRQESRARWKIDTLVIGEDPFAFVDLIRRLEAGATVAMLVDRPPPIAAAPVELFGRTFSGSIAAAELARACGCVLLPVYLPKVGDAYAAHVLPPIPYERAALGNRETRQQLTQEIMRVFEPIIMQHLDQWFHFVPVWPKK